MNSEISVTECIAHAKKLEALYVQESRKSPTFCMSFGQWVMSTHYPDVQEDSSIRNMCTTSRTADAYLYLLGILISGRLPIIDLERTKNETHKHS